MSDDDAFLVLERAVARSVSVVSFVLGAGGCAAAQPSPVQPAPVPPTQIENQSERELAEVARSPIPDLSAANSENDTDFGIGPHKRVANTLNLQPVLLRTLSSGWWLGSRTIIPLRTVPDVSRDRGYTVGLGDISESLYVRPAKRLSPNMLGLAGLTFLLPTATASELGFGKWGLGPTVAWVAQPGAWTFGILMNNVWSIFGPSDRRSVNVVTIRYDVSYSIGDGWYVSSSPVILANWTQSEVKNVWTIPFGGGGGKVFKLRSFALDTGLGAYWNAVRPRSIPAPEWQLRLTVQLFFKKAD